MSLTIVTIESRGLIQRGYYHNNKLIYHSIINKQIIPAYVVYSKHGIVEEKYYNHVKLQSFINKDGSVMPSNIHYHNTIYHENARYYPCKINYDINGSVYYNNGWYVAIIS